MVGFSSDFVGSKEGSQALLLNLSFNATAALVFNAWISTASLVFHMAFEVVGI